MKPQLLTIKNIGPFVGTHKIDFTGFDAIFLVTGKTGAGKTTIFDAISYVFYSRPQGARAQILRTMRSQFASDSETAEVELIFTMGSDKYKIFRRLPFLKPGHKHESPEEVSLAEFKNNEWKDLSSTNKSETDKKIASIIKLTEKEFMRIVLLPQGKFAEFLRENSNQKKETLAQLFPISKYSEIMQLAKEKEKREKEQAKYIETSLKELEKDFSIDEWQIKKKQIEEDLALSKKNYLDTSEKIRIKSEEKNEAKILKQKQKELEESIKEIEKLRMDEETMSQNKIKIDKAQKALGLSSQAHSIKKLELAIEENKYEIKDKIKVLNATTAKLKTLEEEKETIEEAKEKSSDLKQSLKILEKANLIKLEIEEKKQALENIKDKKEQAENKFKNTEKNEKEIENNILTLEKIIEKLESISQDSEKKQNEFNYVKRLFDISQKKEATEKLFLVHSEAAKHIKEKLETTLKDTDIEKNRLEELKAQENHEKTMQKAASIAIDLKDKEPCPVCGSTEHPKLAKIDGDNLYSIQEKITSCERNIKKLNKEKEDYDKDYNDRKRDSEIHKSQLEECKTTFKNLNSEYSKYDFIFNLIPESEEIKSKLETTRKEYEETNKSLNEVKQAGVTKLDYEKKLKKIQENKQSQHTILTEIKLQETSLNTSLNEKQKQFDESFKNIDEHIIQSSIDETMESCKSEIFRLDWKVKSYDDELSQNKIKESNLKNSIDEKNSQMEKWNSTLEKEKKILNKDLKEKDFNSLEELFDSLLEERKIKELENEYNSFNERKITLKQKLAGLELELKDKKIIEPELIEEEIYKLEKIRDEEKDRTTQLTAEKAQKEEKAKQRESLIKKINLHSDNAEAISIVSKNINGDNKLKLKFDIWILSAYLREITSFANLRLEKMSSGRFILEVSEETTGNKFSGLDLKIYDVYTGQTRHTASLSGGETFIVSISLALGLADSIQARNGGIKLDSMFIDEGFGTLDDATLENAISILDEVRGKRMVGIISHVSELQTRIPQKICVQKSSNGSGIQIQN